MNVNAKYLKDENGNIISPIVDTTSIFHNNVKLSNYIDDYVFSTALGTSTGADTKINVYLGEGHYTLIMERIY